MLVLQMDWIKLLLAPMHYSIASPFIFLPFLSSLLVNDFLTSSSNKLKYPCFKYWPCQSRNRLISPFLPTADTIWENRLPYRLQQKRLIFEISADKSADIGR